jgi:hypothetical protein
VPEGAKPVPEGATTRECAGYLILVQREVMHLQAIIDEGVEDAWAEYRRRHPRGLTRNGMAEVVARAMFGNSPLARAMPRLNLLEPVSHPGLAVP